MSIQGKTVLLTGASRGIGRSIALRLARENVRLALCARDTAALEKVAAEAKSAGASAVFVKAFDLAEERAIVDFVRSSSDAVGPADVLINNAGFNPRKAPVAEVTTEEFDGIVAVNLRAPFILLREVLRAMILRRTGHIVNILSTVCHYANESMGAYTAAKRGLEGLAGVLLKEARPQGVRVSAVYPGGTDTTFRAVRRPDYMSPDSVAEAVYAVLTLPEDLTVHSMTFRPWVETNF
ncbi:MAG TPA: SDR family oxidoreductase [Planctomycetota bacterium]|jgi:NAD(P)-dependent dehydrogenase (short-subunit alcohol dehydrogenase family)|nr:SDR family oxidoreductase [Planctomycetota bacterium]